MTWKKVDDKWQKTESQTSEYEESEVYEMKESIKAKQDLLNRLVGADLTKADGPNLDEVAYKLKQGVSMVEQITEITSMVDDLPTVPKPVVVKEPTE